MEKSTTIYFNGSKRVFYLQKKVLNSNDVVKELGIYIHESLSSKKYIEHRVKKANAVLYILKQNISPKNATNVKPGLYKSAILPILVYGLQCVALKTDLAVFGKFQKRCVTWRAGVQTGYEIQFASSNLSATG